MADTKSRLERRDDHVHVFEKDIAYGDDMEIWTNPDENVEIDRCKKCGLTTYRIMTYVTIKR